MLLAVAFISGREGGVGVVHICVAEGPARESPTDQHLLMPAAIIGRLQRVDTTSMVEALLRELDVDVERVGRESNKSNLTLVLNGSDL